MRIRRISLVLMCTYSLKTLIVHAHNGVYEITCKCIKGVISVFWRIDQEYEKSKVDLDKLKLGICN